MKYRIIFKKKQKYIIMLIMNYLRGMLESTLKKKNVYVTPQFSINFMILSINYKMYILLLKV